MSVSDPTLRTVCGSESWFVHTTVVPAFTDSAAGENAKSLIITVGEPVAGTSPSVVGPADDVRGEWTRASATTATTIASAMATTLIASR